MDLQSAANVATVIGVPIGIAAAVAAVASLRSQARSQRLQAIIKTNEFWQAVAESTGLAGSERAARRLERGSGPERLA